MIRYLLGFVLAGIAVGPVVAGASSWRARLLPCWSGPPAVLADTVITLAAITLTAEVLGAAGLFRLAPMTISLASAGATGWLAARWLRTSPRSSEIVADSQMASTSRNASPVRNSRPTLIAALAATSVVIADWSTRTVSALHHGMSSPADTIWYHMPVAARFVQDGSTTGLYFVNPGVGIGSEIPFYPANGELFHALGILFFGDDFLSPLLNIGWLALAFLAAWCVGRPFGVAPVSLTSVAVLMATPGLVATQPGGAYTDVVGLALIASAAALLVNSGRPRQPDWLPGVCVAAAAAGLALGTKFTFVAPVILLTIGVLAVAPRGERFRQGSLWTVIAALTGGFWYLRNWLTIGNPLPSGLHLGPFSLPSPPSPATSSVGRFVMNAHDWHRWFLPGLRQSLGPAWWVVLGLTGAGLVLGVGGRLGRVRQMLALVGIASGVFFVFTPQLLTLPPFYPNEPFNFVYNLRYSYAAVIFGLVLLATVPAIAQPRVRWGLMATFGAVLMATQLDSTIWPTGEGSQQFGPAISGIDSQIGLLVGLVSFAIGTFLLLSAKDTFNWRARTLTLALTAVVVLGFGFGLQQLYLRDRYLNTEPLPLLYAWAQHIHDTRIAITGPASNDSYPLDGRDDSNYVQVVGKLGPHGSFSPIVDCREFRRVINAGHYGDVIAITAGNIRDSAAAVSQPTEWIGQDPAARLIFRRTSYGLFPQKIVYSIFHLDGRLHPAKCS